MPDDIGYHEKKRVEGIESRKKFAHAYARLLRDRAAAGQSAYGIKYKAAILAGYGSDSWSEAAAYKTRRTMACRLMKDPVVQEELKNLGLMPHPVNPREWVIAGAVKNPAPQNGDLFHV